MSKLDEIYESLEKLQDEYDRGVSALELSEYMNLDRANISRYLNILYKESRVDKTGGRPVIYSISAKKEKISEKINKKKDSFNSMIGANLSLQIQVQQAKAAMLYPPHGLHTLILGETGVGKSMFAELMYRFAIENGMLKTNAPFVRFNCADYADNPQLVIAQIFGVKKGAYTGADSDREGLLKKADGGIIFLDEIHRLAPQAQEMLFTYIDNGVFRPLGETEKLTQADAQIIAATTEEPKSFMLRTFTRRIPMMITLPPLKERTVKERYYLMENFIKNESKRLDKSIYFNKNAFISFLLYDCPNNIGQLKSDIQLACAKAFLNYKVNDKSIILVEQGDLTSKVKKGIMKLQEYRNDIESLLENMGNVLEFNYKNDDDSLKISLNKHEEKNKYFYDIIEGKFRELKSKGIAEKEISEILNIDINKYFKKYINDLKKPHIKEDISKIVDISIINIVEEILVIASEKLNRQYDEKVYLGLALHLQGSIERIKRGIDIYHPKLNFIRSEYSDEFYIAMEAAKIVDEAFDIKVPLDEIGYLTMFIATKPYDDIEKKIGNVRVLVIMHGFSTATSMADVANKLIGENYAEALDMPLDMKAEEMYALAKEKIIDMGGENGVLLLVDMGSLTNFGDMISEETGIRIKTVDMVTTLMVIEAVRKSIDGRSLDDIYRTCIEMNGGGLRFKKIADNHIKGTAIITSCFTGEGSAEKIKQILNKNLINSDKVEIIPLNILDRNEFTQKVEFIKDEYNVIAIVGTVNIRIEGIPFVPAPDILRWEGIDRLDKRILQEEDYYKLSKSVDDQFNNLDGVKLVALVRKCIKEIEERLNLKILHEVEVGIILHLCFLVDNRVKGGKDSDFDKLSEYREKHAKEFILIKQSLRILESTYSINITDNQIAFIIRIMIENNVNV
ncbi:sigma 54 modulation protein [Clostridium sp. DSM 8431]|uniref:sigma 54-interacting transcriptional regulator n=1 Tax=Clostridium sp. DSM 8431 TaxID=1761781 RepID=UPI0008EA305D|nr:sigma-54-dependent transcriptional regulator [Clostridium sp. DSM 8431]SFU58878.1 sigma 54 modulation protein [Clostridium sp. DSM 8431]